jgi:hypothetical protein
MVHDIPARIEARKLREKAKTLSKEAHILAKISGAEDLAEKKAMEAKKLMEEAQRLQEKARLEDLKVVQEPLTKTTKKGERREYFRWVCYWREGGRLCKIYLGSCKKISQAEALAKATMMKSTFLQIGGLDKMRETIQRGGSISTISQKRAREIMSKNFFGVEEAVKYFRINPTRQQLATLSDIPFSEALLEQSKNTHVLIAVFPLSILEIRDKVDPKLFYNHEDAWYDKQSFAKEAGEVSWQLIRKVSVDDSMPKNWQEQQALFGKNEEMPTAQALVYMAIGYFLSTGEQFMERKYACTSSVDSSGNRVYISDVGLDGLGISDYWDAVRYDNEDLSSPRKL